MDKFDISHLKRNPDTVRKCMKHINDTTIATQDLSVIFPQRFEGVDLAIIGTSVDVIGFFAIVDSTGHYGTIQAPIMITFSPREVKDIEIQGVRYKRLIFLKDDIMIPYRYMPKSADVLYPLFREFLIQGKVPWYMRYEDVAGTFQESLRYANHKIGIDTASIECVTAHIARNPKNTTEKIRYKVQSLQEAQTNLPVKYIGLSNVMGLDNTGSFLIGNYWVDSMTKAVNSEPVKNSPVTDILRG